MFVKRKTLLGGKVRSHHKSVLFFSKERRERALGCLITSPSCARGKPCESFSTHPIILLLLNWLRYGFHATYSIVFSKGKNASSVIRTGLSTILSCFYWYGENPLNEFSSFLICDSLSPCVLCNLAILHQFLQNHHVIQLEPE